MKSEDLNIESKRGVKAKKFYNPYPFPVRIKNDLNEEQTLAPHGGHAKLFNKRNDQSPLNLEVYDDKKRPLQKKLPGLDLDLNKVVKADCIKLAWAMCIEDDCSDLTKKDIVVLIENKVEEWPVNLGEEEANEDNV